MKSIAALSLAMIAFFSVSVLAQEEGPPNFIVFLTDDQGWGDLGCYGHPVIQSPNLDRFASEGIRLTQCYAACSVCSPSRSAIVTGRTPYRNGVWRWIPSGSQYHLRASEITIASLLKKQGYQTCHAGKWHLNGKFNSDEQPQPDDHGYDHWLATQNNASPNHLNPENFVRNGQQVGRLEGPSSMIAASEAIQWLKSRGDKSTPFFITVWTHEPHLPIESAPEFMAPYADIEDEGLRQHHGNITQMDAAFGKLMSAVDAMGYRDNTVVFFTSDNGPEGNGTTGRTRGSTGGLRGRKRHTHEGGIRVPGIIRWPGRIEAGSISATPAIGSDIFTTICDIAGVPIPDDRTIDGASLRPLFEGKPVERDQPLYWRNHLAPLQFRVGLRIGDWKMVASEDLDSFELYNIHEDPLETKDLSDDHPQKFEELKQRLIEHDASVLEEGPDWWKDDAVRPRSRSRTIEPSAGKDSSGTFEVVLGTDVGKTNFGFRLEPEQEGLAFLKLPEPIVGQATVRMKYRSASQGQ
ncbi:MAG: sulfatase-like hydrolase/transferase, partial [Planctomycetota bacterium]|nr:sulfatase-like hydrolase/transferase [Planctomycetota bacterium]